MICQWKLMMFKTSTQKCNEQLLVVKNIRKWRINTMTVNATIGVKTTTTPPAGQTGMNQATDSYSKNIQRQISNAQKQLQELLSNEDMSMEEKMKKRQEINQEISNLNNQLRQHQIEKRKEQQQSKSSSMDDMLGGKCQEQKKSVKSGTAMSSASMQAIIAADASMEQVKVQSQVKSNMEGRAGVLKAEIKQDTGGNTEAKEAELADVEGKVNDITSSQMSTLSDINKTLEEAAKEDSKTEKTAEKKDLKTEKDMEEVGENNRVEAEENVAAEAKATTSDAAVSEKTSLEGASTIPAGYTHVDIKL